MPHFNLFQSLHRQWTNRQDWKATVVFKGIHIAWDSCNDGFLLIGILQLMLVTEVLMFHFSRNSIAADLANDNIMCCIVPIDIRALFSHDFIIMCCWNFVVKFMKNSGVFGGFSANV